MMGSGSAVFLGIRDRAVPYWWDQGRKLVTLLESRIRNLRTKNGINDEKTSWHTVHATEIEIDQSELSTRGKLSFPTS